MGYDPELVILPTRLQNFNYKKLCSGCRRCWTAPPPLCDRRTEGEKRELGHLEALKAKRDAHDSDAAQYARYDVGDRHRDASKDHPEDIGDYRWSTTAVYDGFAEGCQREACHLETLTPQGDTDDGNAEDQSKKQPSQSGPDATQKNPYDVSKSTHSFPFQYYLFSRLALLASRTKPLLYSVSKHRNADIRDSMLVVN